VDASAAAHQSLIDTLQRENEVVSRLHQLLKSEFDQLSRRDVDRIEETLEAKQTLMTELAQLSVSRCNILTNKGYSADKAGHDAFMEALDGAAGELLRQSWETLQEALAACQQQNQVNGQVLEASRRSAEQALSVLLGGNDIQPSLYNDKGATQPSMRGNSHIKV
jgi:flagellar biosynthesis/type III secretory pathway chaperone